MRNISQIEGREEGGGRGKYKLSLFLTSLKYFDTGEYICQYKHAANETASINDTARIYVYVPGMSSGIFHCFGYFVEMMIDCFNLSKKTLYSEKYVGWDCRQHNYVV